MSGDSHSTKCKTGRRDILELETRLKSYVGSRANTWDRSIAGNLYIPECVGLLFGGDGRELYHTCQGMAGTCNCSIEAKAPRGPLMTATTRFSSSASFELGTLDLFPLLRSELPLHNGLHSVRDGRCAYQRTSPRKPWWYRKISTKQAQRSWWAKVGTRRD